MSVHSRHHRNTPFRKLELDIKPTTNNQAFTIPAVNGGTYNYFVDYGNGTIYNTTPITTYNSVSASTTYASSATTYKFKLWGKFTKFRFANAGSKLLVRAINNIGRSLQLTDLDFYGCTNLTNIVSNGGIYPWWKSFYKLTSLYQFFENNTSWNGDLKWNFLQSAYNLTDCSWFFYNCPNLQYLDSRLLNKATKVTTLFRGFQNATNGKGLQQIPSGGFLTNQVNCTDMSFIFANSQGTGFTSLPSDIFGTNTSVTNLSYLFYGCYNLSSIPSTIYSGLTNVTDMSYMFVNNKFSATTSGLFDNNVKVTTFEYVYQDCRSLQVITPNLFANNSAVTTFNGAFYAATTCVLNTIPSGLFDAATSCTNMYQVFRSVGSSTLTSIPENLFIKNTKVTNFSYAFSLNRNITLPTTLFNLTGMTKSSVNVSYMFNESSVAYTAWGTAQPVWDYLSGGTYTRMFYNSTGLTNYASIPATYK